MELISMENVREFYKSNNKRDLFAKPAIWNNPTDIPVAIGFVDSTLLDEERAFSMLLGLIETIGIAQLIKSRKAEMKVKDLIRNLGLETHNYEWIDSGVDKLMGVVYKFNVTKSDKNPGWEKRPILDYAKLQNGTLSISFSEPVWEKLIDPILYAYIKQKGFHKFKSKYTERLHNWAVRNTFNTDATIHTSMEIADFLTGALRMKSKKTKDYYSSYARLNNKIIKPSCKLINGHTNVEVIVKPIWKNRKVIALDVFCTNVGKRKLIQDKEVVFSQNKEKKLPSTEAMSPDIKREVHKLHKLGLSLKSGALEEIALLVSDLGEEKAQLFLEDIATETQEKVQSKTINSAGAFIRSKLKHRPLDFSEQIEEEKQNKEAEKAKQTEEKREAFSKYSEFVGKNIEAYIDKKNAKIFSAWLESNWESSALPSIEKIIQDGDILLKPRADKLRVDLYNKESVLGRAALVSIMATVYIDAFPINKETLLSAQDMSTEERKKVLTQSEEAIVFKPEYRKYLKDFNFSATVNEDLPSFWNNAVASIS